MLQSTEAIKLYVIFFLQEAKLSVLHTVYLMFFIQLTL